MAIKKSELYASLWASCDELRGGMDASPRRFASHPPFPYHWGHTHPPKI